MLHVIDGDMIWYEDVDCTDGNTYLVVHEPVFKKAEIDQLTNSQWADLIAKNFNVSKSLAKDMLHAMHSVYGSKKRVDEAIEKSRTLPKKPHNMNKTGTGKRFIPFDVSDDKNSGGYSL